VWADYTAGVTLPDLPTKARRVAFFPGSTIGNLHPDEASAFLRTVRDLVGDDGGMVLGVDRRKDSAVLDAAYNDTAGVTAAFNLNMLAHLNREFDGDFDLSAFRHEAHFNAVESRIEMHLQAVAATTVRLAGDEFHVAEGESIRTEVSYKYDRARLDAVAHDGGWRVEHLFTDDRNWFWVAWLRPA
jgi:dimethylhistidine N-methyltransferase